MSFQPTINYPHITKWNQVSTLETLPSGSKVELKRESLNLCKRIGHFIVALICLIFCCTIIGLLCFRKPLCHHWGEAFRARIQATVIEGPAHPPVGSTNQAQQHQEYQLLKCLKEFMNNVPDKKVLYKQLLEGKEVAGIPFSRDSLEQVTINGASYTTELFRNTYAAASGLTSTDLLATEAEIAQTLSGLVTKHFEGKNLSIAFNKLLVGDFAGLDYEPMDSHVRIGEIVYPVTQFNAAVKKMVPSEAEYAHYQKGYLLAEEARLNRLMQRFLNTGYAAGGHHALQSIATKSRLVVSGNRLTWKHENFHYSQYLFLKVVKRVCSSQRVEICYKEFETNFKEFMEGKPADGSELIMPTLNFHDRDSSEFKALFTYFDHLPNPITFFGKLIEGKSADIPKYEWYQPVVVLKGVAQPQELFQFVAQLFFQSYLGPQGAISTFSQFMEKAEVASLKKLFVTAGEPLPKEDPTKMELLWQLKRKSSDELKAFFTALSSIESSGKVVGYIQNELEDARYFLNYLASKKEEPSARGPDTPFEYAFTIDPANPDKDTLDVLGSGFNWNELVESSMSEPYEVSYEERFFIAFLRLKNIGNSKTWGELAANFDPKIAAPLFTAAIAKDPKSIELLNKRMAWLVQQLTEVNRDEFLKSLLPLCQKHFGGRDLPTAFNALLDGEFAGLSFEMIDGYQHVMISKIIIARDLFFAKLREAATDKAQFDQLCQGMIQCEARRLNLLSSVFSQAFHLRGAVTTLTELACSDEKGDHSIISKSRLRLIHGGSKYSQTTFLDAISMVCQVHRTPVVREDFIKAFEAFMGGFNIEGQPFRMSLSDFRLYSNYSVEMQGIENHFMGKNLDAIIEEISQSGYDAYQPQVKFKGMELPREVCDAAILMALSRSFPSSYISMPQEFASKTAVLSLKRLFAEASEGLPKENPNKFDLLFALKRKSTEELEAFFVKLGAIPERESVIAAVRSDLNWLHIYTRDLIAQEARITIDKIEDSENDLLEISGNAYKWNDLVRSGLVNSLQTEYEKSFFVLYMDKKKVGRVQERIAAFGVAEDEFHIEHAFRLLTKGIEQDSGAADLFKSRCPGIYAAYLDSRQRALI